MAPTMSRMRHEAMGLSQSLVDEFSVFEFLDQEKKKHPVEVLSNGSLRLDHSLVGFDPILEVSESRDDQGPWNDDASDNLESSVPTIPSKGSAFVSRRIPRSCSNELRELATELARAIPRALTKEEEIEITLGGSTKQSSVKKKRKLMKAAGKKSLVSTTQVKKPVEDEPPSSTSPSPKQGRRKTLRRAISAKMSPRSKKKSMLAVSSTISPEQLETGHDNALRKSPKMVRFKSVSKLSLIHRRNKSSTVVELTSPSLYKPSPTSLFKDEKAMTLKTSEQEPSPHQVAIPSSQELFVHSKLCALMDSYTKLDETFDFNVFKGLHLQELHKACLLNETNDYPEMSPVHKVLLQQLLNCASDIHVEGFFTRGKDKDLSIVGIFSRQSSGRLIVVYRGTTEQQLKPARTKSRAVNLDSTDNTLPVYAPVRDAYFDKESRVYKLLDKLIEKDPFCEVTFVGHAFGGALATIGAVRLAMARPMQRFSCHVFASPKVGTHDFRNTVNALGNLNIMRVECSFEPNTTFPVDVGNSLKWENVGHTIAIHSSVVVAYRFDYKKPPSTRLQIGRTQNSIHDYVEAIKPFALIESPWIQSYIGEDGKGVRGQDNETRHMV